MLRIWGRETSTNVQKVLWTCEELGLPYERIDLGGPFGGLDTPRYRALNPNGLIPTIEDGDFVLWESHAIIRYLAAGDPQRRLLPASLSRREQANIDRWMDWSMVTLGLGLRNLFKLVGSSEPGVTRAGSVASATEHVARLFAILDQHLQHSRRVGGEEFTLADIPPGISAHRWLNLPVERPALPALQRWYADLRAREAFQRILAIPVR
jgi:glutathione S-transferase